MKIKSHCHIFRKATINIGLFLLLSIGSFAQSNKYHPLPDTNAVWRIDWYSGGVYCFDMFHLHESYQYTIGGDTAIGIYTYKKIFRSGKFICNPYAYNYWGGLRQDTLNKKVYFKGVNHPDTLIYDFTKQVGDTLHLADCSGFFYPVYGYTLTINSIDSVLVGNNYHKRFKVGRFGGSIIEGVGGSMGLLEGGQLDSLFEDNFYLICFSHNPDFYPNTSTSCPLITNGISQFPDINNKLVLFPNPSNKNITLQSNTELGAIIIYNSLGEIVLQMKSKNLQEEQIDINKYLQAFILCRHKASI